MRSPVPASGLTSTTFPDRILAFLRSAVTLRVWLEVTSAQELAEALGSPPAPSHGERARLRGALDARGIHVLRN